MEIETQAEAQERELSPEKLSEFTKLKEGATNVIKSFGLKRSPDNRKGENLLIITDSGADGLIIKALFEAGKEIAGNDCRLIVAPRTEHAAQEFGQYIGERMKSSDAILLLTTLSRSHAKETAEVMHPRHSKDVIAILLDSPAFKYAFSKLRKYSAEDLQEKLETKKLDPSVLFPSRSRFISITNTRKETLTEGGALEDPNIMVERIDRFAEIMKDVESVKATGKNGMDLEVSLKISSLMKENGVLTNPGGAGNFPSGEFGGAVNINKTNGIYIADGAIGMIGKTNVPIKITIENGVATKIEGGEEAKKLKEILDKADKTYRGKNPEDITTSAYKIAEFSFGMNSKAFRYNESGDRISPPTSLEAEKGLGTIHIALGKNSLFNMEKGDPDYNDIPIHIDCVSMEPTVVGIKNDGSEIKILENGNVVCL